MVDLLKNRLKTYLLNRRNGNKFLYKSLEVFLKPFILLRVLAKRLSGKIDMLFLDVTNACNLKCISCPSNAGSRKHNEMNLEEKKSVIRQAKNMGADRVVVCSTGEPLLCKDLFELIDYIKEMNLAIPSLFTNGTLITRDVAEFLIKRKVNVYFKLWSFDQYVVEQLVGVKNAYQWSNFYYRNNGVLKCVNIPLGLKNLLDEASKAGREYLVNIEILITKINYSSIPQIVKFCKDMKLGLWLETVLFNGKALENYNNIELTSDEYRLLYEQLEGILGKNYFKGLRKQKCLVERNPVVCSDGEIGLCSSRWVNIGNVRDVPLKELFKKSKEFKRKEDRLIKTFSLKSRYFRNCRARQYYETKYGLACNY